MNDSVLEELCESAQSFYDRGYAFGSTGNLSVRLDDGVWITPTGKPLAGLTPAKLACLDLDGVPRNGNAASKEFPFHLAAYSLRNDVRAIVHLHSTYAVALSCLGDLDETEPLPAITPYYFMRVAPLAIVPYLRPGSPELAAAVGEACRNHNCLLLRNHGLITLGATWAEAVDRAEELEQTARLGFLLRGQSLRCLTAEEIAELGRVFGKR